MPRFAVHFFHAIFAPLSSSISEYWVSTFESKNRNTFKTFARTFDRCTFSRVLCVSMSFIQFVLFVNRKSLLHLHKTRLHFLWTLSTICFSSFSSMINVDCVDFWWVVSKNEMIFRLLLASKVSRKLIRVNLNNWAYFSH